jgi:biopolymer transport protein ExbB
MMETRRMQNRRLLRVLMTTAVLAILAAPFAVAQDDPAPAGSADKGPAAEGRADELTEAAAAKRAPQGLWQHIEALWAHWYSLGGRTMVFLAAASIVGLASVLERAISLIIAAFSVHGPVRAARELWSEGRFSELEKLARSSRGITARLIHFIVGHREYHVADVSAGVGDLASRYVKRHVRRNYPLAVVATISPLLGLFGTVVGMIEAFEQVNLAGSMGSAEYLSGAISKALITTAGGLLIAMPALFFYHLYKFLTGVLADTLEGKANEMITGWLMRKEAA